MGHRNKHQIYAPPPGPPTQWQSTTWAPQSSSTTSQVPARVHASRPISPPPSVMAAHPEISMSVYDEFEPTQAEQKVAKHLLLVTDSLSSTNAPTDDAILLGERAVPIFETSGLNKFILGEIWNVCDEHRGGFLTFAGVCLALRLMGHAQKDGSADEVKLSWFRPGELPYLDALAETPRPPPPRPVVVPPAASLPSLLDASPTGALPSIPAPWSMQPLQPVQAPTPPPTEQHCRVLSASHVMPTPRPNLSTHSSRRPSSATSNQEEFWAPDAERQPAFLVRTPSQRITQTNGGLGRTPSATVALARSPSTAGVYQGQGGSSSSLQLSPSISFPSSSSLAVGAFPAQTTPTPPVPSQSSPSYTLGTHNSSTSSLSHAEERFPALPTAHSSPRQRPLDPFADPQQPPSAMAPPSPALPPAPQPQLQLPPLTEAQRRKYIDLWARSGAVDGLLNGEDARSVFVRSRLGFTILGRVWDVATEQAPEHDPMTRTQFIVAMYLIQHLMSQVISATSLSNPRGPEWEPVRAAAAAGTPHDLPRALNAPGPSPTSPGTSMFPPSSSTPPQVTSSPLIRPISTSSDAERAFVRLDAQHTGRVDGGTLLPYFMRSGLSIEVLAEIWDEADLDKDGTLELHEFVKAFNLVRARVPTFDPNVDALALDLAATSLYDSQPTPRSASSYHENFANRSVSSLNDGSAPRSATTPRDAPAPGSASPRSPPSLTRRLATLPPLPQEPVVPEHPVDIEEAETGGSSEPPPAYTLEVGEGERAVETEEGEPPPVVSRS